MSCFLRKFLVSTKGPQAFVLYTHKALVSLVGLVAYTQISVLTSTGCEAARAESGGHTSSATTVCHMLRKTFVLSALLYCGIHDLGQELCLSSILETDRGTHDIVLTNAR